MALTRKVRQHENSWAWAYVETSDENSNHLIILGGKEFPNKEEAEEWAKGFAPDSYEYKNPVDYDKSFGYILEALEAGGTVARKGWNGKNMYLKLVPGGNWGLDRVKFKEMEDSKTELLPWIGMKTADNKFVPWLASQTDILSKDWGVLTYGEFAENIKRIPGTGTEGVLLNDQDMDNLSREMEDSLDSKVEIIAYMGPGYYNKFGIKKQESDDVMVGDDLVLITTREVYQETNWKSQNPERDQEMALLEVVINSAEEHKLVKEVFHTSLQSMKENPSLTIPEAANLASRVWLKE